MTLIEEPVSKSLARSLRAEVLALRTAHSGERFGPQLCVGIPGGAWDGFLEPTRPEERARLDHGLRTEVVALMLDRALTDHPDPLVWLTRPGDLEPYETDVAWLAATLAAGAELATQPAMLVMTRRGWRDQRSGASRVWRRLRARS